MNDKDDNKQQRTFDDILLELMVQNETLDKIQMSALKVVDLLTPVADASKQYLAEPSKAAVQSSNNSLETSPLIERLDSIIGLANNSLNVANNSLITLGSIEAGIVMLTDYSGLIRNSLSIIADDLSMLYNFLVQSSQTKENTDRIKNLQQKEKDAEMLKLLARLGGKVERGPITPAAPKEDGFLAKLLGPLGIIGGLLAGFVTGIVVYFTDLFTRILTSLSKMLSIGNFLRKIGLTGDFFTKLSAPFKFIFGKIGEIVGKFTTFFSKTFGTLSEKFSKFFGIGKLIGRIAGPLVLIFDVFKSISAAMDKFSATGNFGDALQIGIGELLSRVIGMPLDILKSVVSWIAGKLGFTEVEAWLDSFNITAVIKELVDRVVTAGRNVFASVFQFISDFVEDFTKGMQEGGLLGGLMKVFQKIGYYLIAKPIDLLVNYLASLAEKVPVIGKQISGWLRSLEIAKFAGSGLTFTEPPEFKREFEGKSFGEAVDARTKQERDTAKKSPAAEMLKTGTKAATSLFGGLGETLKSGASTAIKGVENSGLLGTLTDMSGAFYKALQENIAGGETQSKIGAVPSTIGAEMSALLTNTRDLESNAEMAAAMAPMSGGATKKTANVSAQSVTYNSNNIPDRTSWMTTPLANWSL